MTGARRVLKVDKDGTIIKRYASVRQAAKDNYISAQTAANWLNGKADSESVKHRYGFTLKWDKETE